MDYTREYVRTPHALKTIEQRIEEWDKWLDIYNGDVISYWAPNANPKEQLEYISVNYAQKIPRHIARLLTNKKPKITVQNPKIQEFIDKVVFNNHLIDKLPGAIISSLILGDYLVRTTYRKINENSPRPEVNIDFVHPRYYRPKFDKWDISKASVNNLVFENKQEDIVYRRTEIDKYNLFLEILEQKVEGSSDFTEISSRQITHEGGLLIQHIAIDILPDEFWGRSIYQSIESLLKQINELFTQIAYVLRKHGKPKLALPANVFDNLAKRSPTYEGSDGRKYIMIKDREVYRVEEGEQLPQYIVWDAKLDANFDFLKVLQVAVSVISDIPTDVLKNADSNVPASGIALQIVELPSIYRAEEIAKIFKRALEQALYQAQILEIEIGNELHGLTAEWVNVEFEIDIPINKEEYIKTEILKYEKGVQSRKRTVTNISELNARELEEELDLIEQENATSRPSETQPI